MMQENSELTHKGIPFHARLSDGRPHTEFAISDMMQENSELTQRKFDRNVAVGHPHTELRLLGCF